MAVSVLIVLMVENRVKLYVLLFYLLCTSGCICVIFCQIDSDGPHTSQ